MSWWGDHSLAIGEHGRWRIGPATIWLGRLEGEWRIATVAADDGDDMICEVEVPAAAPPDLLELDSVVRFGIAGAGDTIAIEPRLADRPVVTRPLRPFTVPPHASVTVFVGSPLWLAVLVGPDRELLVELPIDRPADTWFGPPTEAGQLCYASRTACRLRRDELVDHPHRALSMVEVVNRADTAFVLERMKLPVDYLELYEDDAGELWSQDVILERAADDAPAPMTIRPGAPEHAGRGGKIASAREHDTRNLLVGAFNALFRS